MQTCASVEGAPIALVKNSIDELRNACLPKALALPLIFQDFGTSYWQLAD